MHQRKTLLSVALVAALAATGAFTAEAQQDQHHPGTTSSAAAGAMAPASQGAMGPGMMGQGMMGPGMMGMMGQGMMAQSTMCGGMGQMGMMSARAGHVEGRIAFLNAELKIAEAQLPLWNAVADALRANEKNMTQVCGAMMNVQSATLPERLAAREKVLGTRLEDVRKLKAAIDPLYAALSDDQKKAADQIMPGTGPGTGMGMRSMGMGPAGTKSP